MENTFSFERDFDRVLHLVTTADESDNLSLSLEEFIRLGQSLQLQNLDVRTFRKYDRDNSGQLSLFEVMRIIFPSIPSQVLKNALNRRRRSIQREKAFDKQLVETDEVKAMFALLDVGRRGYVTLDDVRRHCSKLLKPGAFEDDDLCHTVLDLCDEMKEARREDRSMLKSMLELKPVLQHAYIPSHVIEFLESHSITAAKKFVRAWSELEEDNIGLFAKPGELTRLQTVLSLLRRHGVAAVMRTTWSPNLTQPPLPYSILLEAKFKADGTPRTTPITADSATLSQQSFARLMEVVRTFDPKDPHEEILRKKKGPILPFYYEYEIMIEERKEREKKEEDAKAAERAKAAKEEEKLKQQRQSSLEASAPPKPPRDL
eukprot:PhF_6_TR23286/c0_g1_i1/m.32804